MKINILTHEIKVDTIAEIETAATKSWEQDLISYPGQPASSRYPFFYGTLKAHYEMLVERLAMIERCETYRIRLAKATTEEEVAAIVGEC